jgi:two-component system response regulator AtoC
MVRSGTYVIGRARECDVRVVDSSVSRKHAEVILANTVEIRDLGSSNGTMVNGQRLAPNASARLDVGSVFTLGSAVFVLQAASAEAKTLSKPISPQQTSSASRPIVNDPMMQRLYGLLDVFAPSPLNVLITGETGVGKEVFAAQVHAKSKRALGVFMQLNCAALAESILEAELFGFEKGAFTGAVAAKTGLLEAAHGGTVFLDELGDMPLTTQAKLLRFLESGEVLRLGSVSPKKVDVRVVSATNKDLQRAIADGKFRADLYFRLNGIAVHVPPLRERRADIAPLATAFVERVAGRIGRPPPNLDPGAIERLENHSWPGNVRELRNVIERSVVLSVDGLIRAEHHLLRWWRLDVASVRDLPRSRAHRVGRFLGRYGPSAHERSRRPGAEGPDARRRGAAHPRRPGPMQQQPDPGGEGPEDVPVHVDGPHGPTWHRASPQGRLTPRPERHGRTSPVLSHRESRSHTNRTRAAVYCFTGLRRLVFFLCDRRRETLGRRRRSREGTHRAGRAWKVHARLPFGGRRYGGGLRGDPSQQEAIRREDAPPRALAERQRSRAIRS